MAVGLRIGIVGGSIAGCAAAAELAKAGHRIAELFERSLVFEAPDLSALSSAEADAWMTAVHPIFPLTLPES